MNVDLLEEKIVSTQHYDVESLGGLLSPDDLQPVESLEKKKTRRYGFKLGDVNVLLSNDMKREIFENITVKPIPLMPQYINGLCNVRGNLIPVYDLEKKYELTSNKHTATGFGNIILVVGQNEDMVGFSLNELLIPVDTHTDDLIESRPPIASMVSSFVSDCYLINEKYWHEIDHAKLLEELSC